LLMELTDELLGFLSARPLSHRVTQLAVPGQMDRFGETVDVLRSGTERLRELRLPPTRVRNVRVVGRPRPGATTSSICNRVHALADSGESFRLLPNLLRLVAGPHEVETVANIRPEAAGIHPLLLELLHPLFRFAVALLRSLHQICELFSERRLTLVDVVRQFHSLVDRHPDSNTGHDDRNGAGNRRNPLGRLRSQHRGPERLPRLHQVEDAGCENQSDTSNTGERA